MRKNVHGHSFESSSQSRCLDLPGLTGPIRIDRNSLGWDTQPFLLLVADEIGADE